MTALGYVGNEQQAAAFRLIGAVYATPRPGEERAALTAICRQADVVLLAGEIAARLPREDLDRALAAAHPLLLLLPTADGSRCAADPAERARLQLGLEA